MKTKTQLRKEKRERQLKEKADNLKNLPKAEKKVEESKKIRETESKPENNQRKSKDTKQEQDSTLFVRNIGWDTD